MSLKLLMVASTVSPRWGSEGAVGWNWLAQVPSGYSTTLLTSRECAQEVSQGVASGKTAPSLVAMATPETSWAYRPSSRLLRRINEWAKFHHNLRAFRLEAAKLHRTCDFDIVHQTTIASWLLGMPCHTLGIATVWGPIGGAEPFPWRYALETSAANCLFEGGRSMLGTLSRLNPSVLSAVRNVGVIIATNLQTEQMLRSLGRKKAIVRQPMVITQDRFQKICDAAWSKKSNKLQIISGGSIEGRKGFALTIRALRELKQRGVDYQFTVTGHGMELEALQKLVRACDIEDRVRFETNLDTEAYIAKLADAHIFCFPSLRDNSPVTLIEAMAARCVPIVIANGGPAEVVDIDCGVVLPLETPSRTVHRIADTLAGLWSNETLRMKLSVEAQRKVERSFLDSKLSGLMTEAYALALSEVQVATSR